MEAYLHRQLIFLNNVRHSCWLSSTWDDGKYGGLKFGDLHSCFTFRRFKCIYEKLCLQYSVLDDIQI